MGMADDTVVRARRERGVLRVLDNVFFLYAGLATFWLALLLLEDATRMGWRALPLLVVFWGLLAYLALPRLHRILSSIYVPDYFIGRTRTSDGLLGDPVNLALLGDEDRVHQVMRAAGWTLADELTLASSVRIVVSTLTRRSYDEAPVSPLMLFGRQQDFAYQQEVAGNPAKRHHVRFWRCPDGWLLPGGHRVDWLAAGTFDRAVGFSLFTLQITHKIDEDTDVERDHIVSTVLGAGEGARVYLLKDFSTGYHSRNGGGDSIRTDGDLPVIDVRGVNDQLEPAGIAPLAVVTAAASGRADAVGKRVAFDLTRGERMAEAAAAEQVRRHGRPATIVFGAFAVFTRVALTVLALAAVLTPGVQSADRLLADLAGWSPDQGAVVAVLIAGAALIAFELTLGVLVLRGVGVARLVVMAVSAVSTATVFVDWYADGRLVDGLGEVATIAANILVLLALSSVDAREYTWQHDRVGAKRATEGLH